METPAYNLVYFHEWSDLLGRLKEARIPTIVLGGVALAELLYPRLERPLSADIDLLVKPANALHLDNVFKDAGYYPTPGCGEQHYYKHKIHYYNVDVHYHLWYLRDEELEGLWQNAHPFRLTLNGETQVKPLRGPEVISSQATSFGNGTEALTLASDDALIYTALHMVARHGMIKQKWLEDISRLIAANGLNWNQLITKIKRYHLEVPLYYALKSAHSVRLPNEIMECIKPRRSQWLASTFYQRALAVPVPRICHFLQLLARSTWSERRDYLKRLFFPPKDFLSQRYNISRRRFSILFYPVRATMHLLRATKLLIQFSWHWFLSSKSA